MIWECGIHQLSAGSRIRISTLGWVSSPPPPELPLHRQVLPKQLRGKLSGVLFDLGLSSPQLDDPSRGMRPEQSGPLDLRFDIAAGARGALDSGCRE